MDRALDLQVKVLSAQATLYAKRGKFSKAKVRYFFRWWDRYCLVFLPTNDIMKVGTFLIILSKRTNSALGGEKHSE